MAKDDAADENTPEKKSKVGLIIGIVVGVLFLVGGTVAGIVLGPRLMGGAPPANAETVAEGDEPEPTQIVTSSFTPIVIDVRSHSGKVHHLKVGLSAELAEGVLEEEFRLVQPRGREAALSYLRTLSFEDITNPEKYSAIKDELAKQVVEAVGHDKAHRILLVDFVTQ